MVTSRPTPPGQPVFQLRVELSDVEPPIWRRLLVPGSVRMSKLHQMLQASMGWTDWHLHCFTVGEDRYGPQFDEYLDGEIDESTVTVVSALRDHRHFEYEYDFGDCWDHRVEIERAGRYPIGIKFAVCLDGANACPPEDCGGSDGYANLLEALADPTHDDHQMLARWLGGPFDATAFDLVLTNAALQRIR